MRLAFGALVPVTALVALTLTGCPDDGEPSDDTTSSTTGDADTSTGDADTSTGSPGTDSGSTGETESTAGSGSTGSDSTGSDSTSSDSTSSDSSSGDTEAETEGLAECVDEDIGNAMGAAVASGSTVGASDHFDLAPCLIDNYEPDAGADAGEGPASGDYVIAWTAPRGGLFLLSLDGSDFDTTLGVFPATCDGVAQQCNDDCIGDAATTTLDTAAGSEWFIVIDGSGGAEGSFTLSITEDSESCYEPGGTGTTGGPG